MQRKIAPEKCVLPLNFQTLTLIRTLTLSPTLYTTKHYTVVIIQLNIVTCATYSEKFIPDSVVAPFFCYFPLSLSLCLVFLRTWEQDALCRTNNKGKTKKKFRKRVSF